MSTAKSHTDIEELDPELRSQESTQVAMSCDSEPSASNITLPLTEYNELVLKLRAYEAQAVHARADLENVLSDMDTLR